MDLKLPCAATLIVLPAKLAKGPKLILSPHPLPCPHVHELFHSIINIKPHLKPSNSILPSLSLLLIKDKC